MEQPTNLRKSFRMYLPTPLAATAPATPQSPRILPTVAIKARLVPEKEDSITGIIRKVTNKLPNMITLASYSPMPSDALISSSNG
nr:hypothetical protein [uncultured Prevotella sp.]